MIDRAASARGLTPEELAAWAQDQRVFISSVMDGYEAPRKAAAAAVEALGAQPVMFERFGGRDADPEAAYLDEVDSSTIYVGVLGARYGRLLPDRYSATHAEYRRGEQRGLRLSVWSESGVEREGPQQSFFEEVRVFGVTGDFEDPSALQAKLERRLAEIAAEDLSPWVKVGSALFRARQITVGGGRAKIEAVIHDHDVADYLGSLQSQFGSSQTTFAYWDGVYDARLADLTTRTRTGNLREVELQLELSPVAKQTEYSLNGVSYAEATRIAVEVSWFGAANPFGVMSSQAEITDPFSAPAELAVPEESYRPIASILAFETLARERNVRRLTRFRLGRVVSGKRRLELEWVQPTSYADEPDARGSAEGEVAGG
jgi:hypothetical protein